MANETEDGVQPPATNPPDTSLLDRRIDAALDRRPGSGSSGGDGGQYEARIAKLESDVGNLDSNLIDVKATLRTIQSDISSLLQRVTGAESEIKHLPSKGFIVRSVVAALGFFGALILFGHKLQQAIDLIHIGK